MYVCLPACLPALTRVDHIAVAEDEAAHVDRWCWCGRKELFFKRATGDDKDAWRMLAGWDNGLLEMGYDGWYRWGRRARWGGGIVGGSRVRTCAGGRGSLMDGGLIVLVTCMWLTGSIAETS